LTPRQVVITHAASAPGVPAPQECSTRRAQSTSFAFLTSFNPLQGASRMKAFTGLALIPMLATTVACSSQVGEEYTGEVLLRLEGSVKTTNPEQAELAPAL